MSLKVALLHAMKLLGGFAIARHVTRGGLRIICWHSVACADEHLFRPSIFITPLELRRRVAWLKHRGLPILALDEAVRRLATGTLPAGATVLTFDDGWASWGGEAKEILCGLPVTGYVMTSYMDRPEPIFNVFAQYAYWKSRKDRLGLSIGEVTYDQLWAYARRLSFDDRAAWLPEVAEAAGIDLERITHERYFGFLSSRELKMLGWDIQLHTHLHEWSRDETRVAEELARNAQLLGTVARGPLEHFCYPSGEYYTENFAQLARRNILSATTCEKRFNWAGENPLALGRFLDGHGVPDIVFEGELSGVFEVVRWVKAALLGRTETGRAVEARPA
jgi:peptidoglycan/xylan/chitin deacetylase (PgdA/CDA1 family)